LSQNEQLLILTLIFVRTTKNNTTHIMELSEIIGKNLQDYRLKNEYTQDQIATFLGTDRSTISHFEIGDREISLLFLNKLCDLYGIELDELLEPDAASKTANLAFAFRIDAKNTQDLTSIAQFQKIVKNYMKMKKILKNES